MRVGVGPRAAALALAFTGSGAAALLAEQGFERLLSTFLGTSTPAAATVLGAYFGGLTLGGWLYARRRARRDASGGPKRALETYAALEATIAVACLLLAFAFDRLVPLSTPILRLGGTGAGLAITRVLVSALWILPITVPMGATFPAIVDALDALPERRRAPLVQTFYGLNLVGAIASAAFAPYLVYPRVGVDGALVLAATLDSAAALVAFVWARAEEPRAPERAGAAAADAVGAAFHRRELPLLATAGISGFVLFSLEVVWTHLIATVIGNSVYAFATMLALVLSGLGLGALASALLGARLGRVPPPVAGAALAVAGAAIVVTYAAWPEAPHEVALLGRAADSFVGSELARARVAASLLLVPAAAVGTVYPLLLRLDAFPREAAGAVAGRMGAVNAAACIAGALVTAFGLLPRGGSEVALRLLSGLCFAAAGALVFAYVERRWARFTTAAAGVGAAVVLVVLPPWNRLHLTSGEHVYFRRTFVYDTTELRFFAEDPAGGFTTVVSNGAGSARVRVLLTNGKFQGDDGAEMAAQDGFALAPMQLLDRYDEALVIGLGTGRSAHVVRALGFGGLTVVEIAPGIVEAARREFSHINREVFESSQTRFALEDARSFLLLDDRVYDFISIELTSVWWAGATNLYAAEFYRTARARMRKRGVLQQWIQLHHITPGEILSAVASMRASFANVSLFLLGKQGVLVASDGPQIVRREFLERFARGARSLGVADGDVATSARKLAASRLLGPAEVDAVLAADPPRLNTDKNRHLEYSTPRHQFDRTDMLTENVRALASFSSFSPIVLADDVDPELAARVRAPDEAFVKETLRSGVQF